MITINEDGRRMEVIFGTGDIGMNPGVIENNGDIAGVMVLYNQSPREIGSEGDIKAGETVNIGDHPLTLMFYSVESLDVVIKSLNEIRACMVEKNR